MWLIPSNETKFKSCDPWDNWPFSVDSMVMHFSLQMADVEEKNNSRNIKMYLSDFMYVFIITLTVFLHLDLSKSEEIFNLLLE